MIRTTDNPKMWSHREEGALVTGTAEKGGWGAIAPYPLFSKKQCFKELRIKSEVIHCHGSTLKIYLFAMKTDA